MMVTGEMPFGKVGPLDCWMKKQHNELTAAARTEPGRCPSGSTGRSGGR